MVALIGDVLERGVGFRVGLVCILGEVECDIQKSNNVFVGFDGDSQAVLFEDMANTLFDAFGSSWCAVCYG